VLVGKWSQLPPPPVWSWEKEAIAQGWPHLRLSGREQRLNTPATKTLRCLLCSQAGVQLIVWVSMFPSAAVDGTEVTCMVSSICGNRKALCKPWYWQEISLDSNPGNPAHVGCPWGVSRLAGVRGGKETHLLPFVPFQLSSM
jgi:hypothetical protein